MTLRKHTPVLFMIVALLALTLCGGCAQSDTSNSSDSDDTQQEQQSDTKTITDAYGRQVEVPTQVNTAATVGSGARLVVYAGGKYKLIAVTDMETNPGMNRPYAMAYKDLFADLPSTSNGNHLNQTNVNAEQLMQLKPDTIISSRSADECDQLQQTTGIPVIGVSYQNQLFSNGIYDSISCVGEALDTQDHAQSVISKMKEWKQDLDNRIASVPQDSKPSVYVGAINYRGKKSWTGTYAHYTPTDILQANNVADSTGQDGAIDVSLEQIGQWDPDYIFLDAANSDVIDQDYENNPDFFSNLSATRSGNLYTQPSYNFNGTNVGTGICDTYFIGATIYPDAFSDVNLDDKYREIYTTMLDGYDFYTDMQQNGETFSTFPPLS
ncbi:ABC transporter substrate-binding protein [Atopobium sp. oral taxon 416]|uniref:ABC transporter substrate-binding protein n=1 Tax=Atopobium sp. oral taxon 416 TaxID=712157 RepID=UPI001BAE375E|nr:ABC transporter substrate-binding protein [Atopobium sp. oral taxon 416]QUC04428.1 ABC transporter substrate-binding protein [Atopobium sp. oral taxon 416]